MTEPTWQEIVADRVKTRDKRTAFRTLPYAFRMTAIQRDIIKRAAELHNIPMSTYVRRAALALAAYDLEEPIEKALGTERGWDPMHTLGWRPIDEAGMQSWRVKRG